MKFDEFEKFLNEFDVDDVVYFKYHDDNNVEKIVVKFKLNVIDEINEKIHELKHEIIEIDDSYINLFNKLIYLIK